MSFLLCEYIYGTHQVRYHRNVVEGEEPPPADTPPVVVRQTPYQTLHVRRLEPVVDVNVMRRDPELFEVVPAAGITTRSARHHLRPL